MLTPFASHRAGCRHSRVLETYVAPNPKPPLLHETLRGHSRTSALPVAERPKHGIPRYRQPPRGVVFPFFVGFPCVSWPLPLRFTWPWIVARIVDRFVLTLDRFRFHGRFRIRFRMPCQIPFRAFRFPRHSA